MPCLAHKYSTHSELGKGANHVSNSTIIGYRMRPQSYSDYMVREFIKVPALIAIANILRRIPPNLKFEVDDVEREWAYPFKFDFIVCRYMAGSITDWPRLVERIYEYVIGCRGEPLLGLANRYLRNLNPGGWVELQDFDLEYTSDDGTLTDEHCFRQWNKLLLEGLAAIGRTGCPGRQLRGWAEEAGFIDIHEAKLKVPMGSWPKDPYLKKTGMMNLVQMLDGMEAFSLKTFDLLGWSRPETEVFLANVRREMKGNKFHSYGP